MNNWNKVKLGEICDIARGGSPRPITDYITNDSNGINWIKIGDTDESKYITHTEQKIKPEGMKKSRFVHAGDFILSNSMSFGRPYILKIDGCIHDGWLVLQNISEKVIPDYLYFALSSPYVFKQFEKMAVGGVVNNLNSEKVRQTELPLPSIDIQNKITTILDSVDKIMKENVCLLSKYELLLKSKFNDIFTNCTTKSLGEICTFQQGTQVPLEEQITQLQDGYKRFLRIIDYTQPPQQPRYVPSCGKEVNASSVVVVRYGANAGFVGHGYNGILANNLFEISPDEKILSKDFLYLVLKYGTFEKEIHDKCLGAAMPALSFKMINNFSVVTPSLSAQDNFIRFSKKIEEAVNNVKKTINKVSMLRNSLMQEYFGQC